MPRWQETEPGLERAQCVMRPKRGNLNLYIESEDKSKLTGLSPFARAILAFSGSLHPVLDPRIASAQRVERALETDTFLAICEAEGLWVGYSEGKFQVLTGDPGTDSCESKTLRGAYVDYHLKQRQP